MVVPALLTIPTPLVAGVAAQQAPGATLTVLRGSAAVLTADGSPYSPAPTGMTLGQGDQVAALAGSSALITFFDGSEVELGADATVILRELASRGSRTEITLESVVGSTVHRVVTFTDPGSSYRVESGGTVAAVRGTIFGHRRDPTTNLVTVAGIEGRVSFQGRLVRPGQTVTARAEGVVGSGSTSRSVFSALASPPGVPDRDGIEPEGQVIARGGLQGTGPLSAVSQRDDDRRRDEVVGALGTLTGLVIRPTGAPVAGAVVTVPGTSLVGVTDVTGRFRLDNVPTGTTSIQTHAGGSTARVEVTARPGLNPSVGVTLS